MNSLPTHDLEVRASNERERLHASLHELRSRLYDDLNVSAQARKHLLPLAFSAGFLAFLIGYSFSGLFLRK